MNITRYERSLLSQLRYGILQIQLETGRYQGQARDDRHCKICNGGGVLEDQYHFIFKCPAYTLRRGMFIDKVKEKIAHWNNLSERDKESVRKIIAMQPNRVRKKCLYYLIAVFPITFLGFCMEFLRAIFCVTLFDELLVAYPNRAIIGEV